ncbi:hypothetical protein AMELA_G00268780 [Ameiurus melas]|uniref:Uncharacterized protein n=1 Tax=Ameiurus melas TaxID=219545 RepID=A0A7J5ZNB0_AMEME|nr:hypothetical protein AMELA_G00268780 [Ameiurus melas]
MPFDVNHLSASSALCHLASLACSAELSLSWLTSKVRAVTDHSTTARCEASAGISSCLSVIKNELEFHLPQTQYSQDRLGIYQNPYQDKVLTEN